jgi:hypothetical protein
MGLLVAGITGGISLIDTARLTSFKREVDDHIRDLFTFYSRVGRLPGELDNSGKIGYMVMGMNESYAEGSFPTPYAMAGIQDIVGPFIELYLYEISSFKPEGSGITANYSNYGNRIYSYNALNGGIPLSKVYKKIPFVHQINMSSNANVIIAFIYQIPEKESINMVKKLDRKFGDGTENSSTIRGYCHEDWSSTTGWTGWNLNNEYLDVLTRCGEVWFSFKF